MSKKVLLIAGGLLAAGSVAAISAPYFRDGHLRLGEMFGEFGGDEIGSGRHGVRSGKRHREVDAGKDGSAMRRSGKRFDAAADEGDDPKETFARPRRERCAGRDLDEGDSSQDLRERIGRWLGSWARDRQDGEEVEMDHEVGKHSRGSGGLSSERQPGRADRQFARLDQNGDGVIDASDFEARARELAANAARRFMRRFDANGDGKVSREEFDRVAKDRSKVWVADMDLGDDGKMNEVDAPPAMRGRGIVK
jgi:hypothetical protein